MLPSIARVSYQALALLRQCACLRHAHHRRTEKQYNLIIERLPKSSLQTAAVPVSCQGGPSAANSNTQLRRGQYAAEQWLAAMQVTAFCTAKDCNSSLSVSAATETADQDSRSRREQLKVTQEHADPHSQLRSMISVLAQRAALLCEGDKHLVGIRHIVEGGRTKWFFYIGYTTNSNPCAQHWLQPLTQVEAAVAHDLAKCALYGSAYSVNFPPMLYLEEHIAMMKKHLLAKRRTMLMIALTSSTRRPRPSYQTRTAGRAADAAVEAAIEAAELSESTVQKRRMAGCCKDPRLSSSYQVKVTEPVFSEQASESSKQEASDAALTIVHRRSYRTLLQAAVAPDMMRQAVGRLAVNFPADVTSAGVPVMKKWLDLNRHRLTVEKQYWKEKAAAVSSSTSSTSS